MNRLAMMATLCLGFPAAASAQQTIAADSAAVMATLDRMLSALKAKDADGLRATFDSAARMTLLRPAQGGDVQVWTMTGEQFIQVAVNPQGPALDEPIRNIRMQIDGDLASVWAEYQVRINGAVSHCGHDAFHLVRKRGQWKILNVSDTFRQQGCGPMW